ncbi:MAG: S-methyl-5-thioribose-1-phosphate isomerase [Candidatus Aminicenantes bacterium]|nr:S-methyl-5-thioribose-1-phosphate isomerase [Candidatus Aminicenantes bacterium]
MYPVIEWKENKVIMLDQRLLPQEEKFIIHSHYTEVARSIKNMVIRGAPAIGVAAAMGVALGVLNGEAETEQDYQRMLSLFSRTRPTAINLFWALDKMRNLYYRFKNNPEELKQKVIEEALTMDREDVVTNKKIGRNGECLLRSGQTVLTHCNAGALATAGYGTALGVIRAAVENRKKISVIAGETRPYLQGARLTVWELQRDHIPVTLVTDNSAGYLMSKGKIDAVIVGADRIALNGDTANKIGTYSIAVLAKFHHIPFYVAAPISTIDFSLESGKDIPIEERGKEEVIRFRDQIIASPETKVINPGFDITPYRLITAIITEKKVIYPDYKSEIRRLSE